MDTLRHNRNRFVRPRQLETLGAKDGAYLVFTLNRKALIARRTLLQDMLQELIRQAGPHPIIAPLRQEAAQIVGECIQQFDAHTAATFHLIPPLSYLEFGYLTAHAKGIITDSGNVAEEATFNGVPCITLNSYTEHIETVKTGTNLLVGEDAQRLGQAIAQLVQDRWKNAAIPDRWDGRSAERIVSILLEQQP